MSGNEVGDTAAQGDAQQQNDDPRQKIHDDSSGQM
jgi:hypothetical protein